MSNLPAEYRITDRFPDLDTFSREELQQLFTFFASAIFKNTAEADKYETLDSAKNSYDMITAFQYQPPYDKNLAARQKVLSDYREQNKYYLDYLTQIGDRDPKTGEIIVSRILMAEHIVNARAAANNELLWYTKGILSAKALRTVRQLYTESLLYYNAILHNEGFAFYDKYWNYTNYMVTVMTIERVLSAKINKIFDIDDYNERDIRNAFASYGLEFFNYMPDKYRKRLLKKLNEILKNKGTNTAFILIASIFGFENVEVFRYYLVKNFERNEEDQILNLEDKSRSPYPQLFFAEVPYDITNVEDAFLSPDTRYHEYNNFVNTDPLWQATEAEVAAERFNYVNTKYLSMSVAVEMTKNSINIPSFYNFIKGFKYELEDSYKYGIDWMVEDHTLSSTSIHVADLITAMQLVLMHSMGYEDTIIKDWRSVAYLQAPPQFHGFNDKGAAKDERQYYFPNGTIVYGDGTVITKQGVRITPTGVQYYKNGSISFPNGHTLQTDRTLMVDGTLYALLGVTFPGTPWEGAVWLIPGTWPYSDNYGPAWRIAYTDGTQRDQEGRTYSPDGLELRDREHTIVSSGHCYWLYETGDLCFYSGELLQRCRLDHGFTALYVRTDADGTRIYRDGRKIKKDGTIIQPDGKVIPPPPLTRVFDCGIIIYPNGVAIMDNQNVYIAAAYQRPRAVLWRLKDGVWSYNCLTGNISLGSQTYAGTVYNYLHWSYNVKNGQYYDVENGEWKDWPSNNKVLPDGTIVFPTGEKLNPVGQLIRPNGTTMLPQVYDPYLYNPIVSHAENQHNIKTKPLREPGQNTIHDKTWDLGGTQADSTASLEAFKQDTSYRDRFTEAVKNENDYTNYREQERIYSALFQEDLARDVYGDHETYLDYLKECSPELAGKLEKMIEAAKKDETEYMEMLFHLISTLESWISSTGATELPVELSQAAAIMDYLLDFIRQLIEKFKAYTTQFKDVNTVLVYYDPLRETVHLREEWLFLSQLSFADWIDLRDRLHSMHGVWSQRDVALVRDQYMLLGQLPVDEHLTYGDDYFIRGLLPITEEFYTQDWADLRTLLDNKNIILYRDGLELYSVHTLFETANMEEERRMYSIIPVRDQALLNELLLQENADERRDILPSTEAFLAYIALNRMDNSALNEEWSERGRTALAEAASLTETIHHIAALPLSVTLPYRDDSVQRNTLPWAEDNSVEEEIQQKICTGGAHLLATAEHVGEQAKGTTVRDVLCHGDAYVIHRNNN